MHDFPVIQILREINFVESRRSKNAVFANLVAQNLVDLVNCSIQKVQNLIKTKFRAFKMVNMAVFDLQKSSKIDFT